MTNKMPALQEEALKLADVLEGLGEGGAPENLWTADQPDGDGFVCRAGQVLRLMAAEHDQALSDLKLLTEERDSLKAELAAIREAIAQSAQAAPAARVPMTEVQIIELGVICEEDWNKDADEFNQWDDLCWEEYSVVICRAIEAFHGIGNKP